MRKPFARTLSVAKQKGIRSALNVSAGEIKRQLKLSQNLWRFRLIKSWKPFIFDGTKYRYFYHKYNVTWQNERTVEIPIVWEIIKRHPNARVLEFGNVLQHYHSFPHDIVDKYEKGKGVLNQDIVNLDLGKYDLIVSISTLEHVGWDENPDKNESKLDAPEKTLQAVNNLKRHLNPGGMLVFTFPVGANPNLDAIMKDRKIGFTKVFCMKRISADDRWRQTVWEDIENSRYDAPFPAANGLVIGIINA
ncbi:MAG: class I SAM-dependent methyltransferase [Candidatus Bathyarchaeia archaeon]|jgi:SAM-dependent methyltransferase